MVEFISVILGILGSIGGVLYLRHKIVLGISQRKQKKLLKGKPKDFYYEKLDLGAKICDEGRSWYCVRSATVISKVDGLDKFSLGFRVLNQIGPVDMKLIGAGIHLVRMPDVIGFDNFELKMDSPLSEGQSLKYDLHNNFCKEVNLKRSDFILWKSDHQVNHLCLRVVFDSSIKLIVYYQVLSNSGLILSQGDLRPDVITGEYKQSFDHVVPGVTYSINWKYEEVHL